MSEVLPAVALPARLFVVAWIDPAVEATGFDPRSVYVEFCWLPVLGPTATWLYRRLGQAVVVRPEGLIVDVTALSLSLGLGRGHGSGSKLAHALGRLERFGVARRTAASLKVRRALPSVQPKHVAQLVPSIQLSHLRLAGRSAERGQLA